MAASRKIYGGSSMSLLLQNDTRLPSSSHQVLDSLWLHTSDPSSFQGSKSMVDFENGRGSNNIRDRSFFQQGLIEKEENNNNNNNNMCDDDYDPSCFHQTGNGNSKKRRLTSEQVQFLERSFEVENKLEPERKVQLAKELGLQPRQVAIWFQNRRARFKTKQLEKEYGALKASFDKLKADYESLLQQNHKLKQEVNSLKNKLIPRAKDDGNYSLDEKSSPHDVGTMNLNDEKKEEEPIMMELMISNSISNENGSKPLTHPIMVTCKQEDANSAKSDVLDDSDSPHCTDGNHHHHQHRHLSSFMEEDAAESDDFSQDEDDNLSENLLTLPCLPKVEDNDPCYHEQNENTCGFGFPVEDQTFCFWPY